MRLHAASSSPPTGCGSARPRPPRHWSGARSPAPTASPAGPDVDLVRARVAGPRVEEVSLKRLAARRHTQDVTSAEVYERHRATVEPPADGTSLAREPDDGGGRPEPPGPLLRRGPPRLLPGARGEGLSRVFAQKSPEGEVCKTLDPKEIHEMSTGEHTTQALRGCPRCGRRTSPRSWSSGTARSPRCASARTTAARPAGRC